nr:FAD-dependent oxidoreductase [Desulfomarina profundi]
MVRPFVKSLSQKRVAVVGGGPAGLACATVAAARGHRVTLFEANNEIGGQFRLARRIPGKDEFEETLRYFDHQLELNRVDVRLNHRAVTADLQGFDEIVLSTGVVPRKIELESEGKIKISVYSEVLLGEKKIGERVAIIGAGGIGFDMAEFLLHRENVAESVDSFMALWGVDREYRDAGGLMKPGFVPADREIFLLQRKKTKPGAGLGKTTGWIHRTVLKKSGVKMLNGVEYLFIDNDGFHIRQDGEKKVLKVDDVVICAGQLSELSLAEDLDKVGIAYHLIGGALKAGELDAKRAIAQGVELADGF